MEPARSSRAAKARLSSVANSIRLPGIVDQAPRR
jgi:hypothetical protein